MISSDLYSFIQLRFMFDWNMGINALDKGMNKKSNETFCVGFKALPFFITVLNE